MHVPNRIRHAIRWRRNHLQRMRATLHQQGKLKHRIMPHRNMPARTRHQQHCMEQHRRQLRRLHIPILLVRRKRRGVQLPTMRIRIFHRRIMARRHQPWRHMHQRLRILPMSKRWYLPRQKSESQHSQENLLLRMSGRVHGHKLRNTHRHVPHRPLQNQRHICQWTVPV